MPDDITVIGAGAVGVSTAIHLQRRGWRVTLIERGEPGGETSYGNAGVIAPASMVPLNNPDLHPLLAGLLANRSAALRHDPHHVLRNLGWVLAFLNASKTRAASVTSRGAGDPDPRRARGAPRADAAQRQPAPPDRGRLVEGVS